MVDKDDVHIKSFDKPVIAQVTLKFEDGMLCVDGTGITFVNKIIDDV